MIQEVDNRKRRGTRLLLDAVALCRLAVVVAAEMEAPQHP